MQEIKSTFSLVTSIDPKSDPKHRLHMKNHHDPLCEIDLETAQNSFEIFQTTNGSVLCYDTVPSEVLTQIINLEDGSEKFGKEDKEEESSSTKRSRRDQGQPRETS